MKKKSKKDNENDGTPFSVTESDLAKAKHAAFLFKGSVLMMESEEKSSRH